MAVLSSPVVRNVKQADEEYRGFALAQMRILKSYMGMAGLSTHSRVVRLTNGVVVTCRICFGREDVFIHVPTAPIPGGEEITVIVGQLLLKVPAGETYLYDMMRDQSTRVLSTHGETLFPAPKGKALTNAETWVEIDAFSGSVTSAIGEGATFQTYLATDYLRGITYGADATGLVGVVDGVGVYVSDWPFPVLDAAQLSGDFLLLGGRNNGSTWNQFNGLYLYAFNAADSNTWPLFNWTSAIYFASPGSGEVYGFHYGTPILRPRNIEPYTDIKVTFGGLLDSRNPTALLVDNGYFETVTRTRGGGDSDGGKFHTYFYLQYGPFQDTGNPTVAMASLAGFAYGGGDIIPPLSIFDIDSLVSLGALTADPEIHLWSTPDLAPPESPRDLFGLVIAANGLADIYRVQVNLASGFPLGSAALLSHITDYHSHSISFDGRYLAVFRGAATISTVAVFDISDGATKRDSGDVTALTATSGVFVIPSPAPSLPVDIHKSPTDPADTVTGAPTLGGFLFPQEIGGYGIQWGTDVWKILCDDGIHAYTDRTVGRCFKFAVTSIIPAGDGPVSITIEGIEYTAATLGELHPPYELQPYFPGAGGRLLLAHWAQQDAGEGVSGMLPTPVIVEASSGVDITELTQPDISVTGIVGAPDDVYYALSSVGDVTWSGEGLELEPYDINAVRVTVTSCLESTLKATSSCGQVGDTVIAPDIPSLTLTGDTDLNVGDVYSAEGGRPPYVYSFDSGTIDQGGEILSLNGCGSPGTSRLGHVKVKDSCGTEYEREVRLQGGGWVRTGYTGKYLEAPYNQYAVLYLSTAYTTGRSSFDNRAMDNQIHFKKVCYTSPFYYGDCGDPCLGSFNSCYYYPTSWTVWRHYRCCGGPSDRSTLENWLSPEDHPAKHQTDYQGSYVYEWRCP